MNFKDQLKKDLDNVFMNGNEFADTHTLDGKEMLVIVVEDDSEEFNARSIEVGNAAEGIFEKVITIFVKESDYSRPDIGYSLNLDEKKYKVTHASSSAGLLKINLLSYES